MKSKTNILKNKPKTSKTMALTSSKGQYVKAARPGKPGALDKAITVAKVNTTAAVNSGQVALVAPVASLTWDAISGFDPATLDNLSPEELAAGINARQQFLDEALQTAKNGIHWSVQIACQIGLLAKAARHRLPHGRFGEWRLRDCPWISERTLQRYMAISNPSFLAELKAGMKLTDLYKKLGPVVVEDSKNAAPKQTNSKKAKATQDDEPLPIATLSARLKSTQGFLQSCTDDFSFEAPAPSGIAELLSEISALKASLDKLQAKLAKLVEPKVVKGAVIPVDSNGVALHGG